jgi:LDH2 family malate/lactate/ureidoglycolate dehydrogenase
MQAKSLMVDWQSLREFMRQVFIGMGMPDADALTESEALIWANLRGVDSHGVVRLPWYMDLVDTNVMNPKPSIRIVAETPATVLIEADRAFGPVATGYAVDLAVEKARNAGVCWVLIRNVTHQGAMGQYAQMVARNDMAGIVIACGQPNMAPYGARVPGVGNCPLSICIPTVRHPFILLDMATSLVALGKVLVARESGVPMPEGWALDRYGNPTTDPRQLAALLPVGGPKGSGMALVFECLASVMAANALVQPVISGAAGTAEGPMSHVGHMGTHNQNSTVMALNIAAFTDVAQYKAGVDDLIDSIKALPKADGFDEIFMPGEIEERRYAERLVTGIPIPVGTVAPLKAIAKRLCIDLPPQLA